MTNLLHELYGAAMHRESLLSEKKVQSICPVQLSIRQHSCIYVCHRVS